MPHPEKTPPTGQSVISRWGYFIFAVAITGWYAHVMIENWGRAVLGFAAVPATVWAVLLLDVREREPLRLVLFAFIWGIAAVLIIYFWVPSPFATSELTAIIKAPVSEELIKSFALFWIIYRHPLEVNSTIDAVVYGFWVGLGFSVAEDAFYFIPAQGTSQLIDIMTVRSFLTAFGHPVLCAIVSVGIYRGMVTGNVIRWSVIGLTLGILLHAIHNLFCTAWAPFAVDWWIFGALYLAILFILPAVFRGAGPTECRLIRAEVAHALEEGKVHSREATWMSSPKEFDRWITQTRAQWKLSESLALRRLRKALGRLAMLKRGATAHHSIPWINPVKLEQTKSHEIAAAEEEFEASLAKLRELRLK